MKLHHQKLIINLKHGRIADSFKQGRNGLKGNGADPDAYLGRAWSPSGPRRLGPGPDGFKSCYIYMKLSESHVIIYKERKDYVKAEGEGPNK